MSAPRERPVRSAQETGDIEETLLEGMSPSFIQQAKSGASLATLSKLVETDWIVPGVRYAEPQTMDDEVRRLQNLQHYRILGSLDSKDFDKLTKLGSRLFQVPICLVSFVDLGRQWFKSRQGLDVAETPRQQAFCTHTIYHSERVFVVLDAQADERFRQNPLVTGPPHIRFYAGATLLSPEGFKLGTFCIIDSQPRTQFNDHEHLQHLADLTMQQMIQRLQQHRPDPVRLIAYAAHDIMTPLTGVQLCLGLLKEDRSLKETLHENQLELLNTASSCSDLMIRICQNALDRLRSGGDDDDKMGIRKTNTTVLADLIANLHTMLEAVPKRVPCVISLGHDVPERIVFDDLILFRAAMSLISNAAGRLSVGMIVLEVKVQEGKLWFECTDTGAPVPTSERRLLFLENKNEDRMNLSNVRSLMDSIQGDCGYTELPDGKNMFWFCVPFTLPLDVPPTPILLPTVSDSKPSARTRRALIIDDSQVIRKSLGRALGRLGFEVSLAEDGLQGLERLKACIFDVVLCDFLMPVLDGINCVKQYRQWEGQNRPWFRQFIVGISAHADSKDQQQGTEVGMDSFQAKPIKIEVLRGIQNDSVRYTKQLDEHFLRHGELEDSQHGARYEAKGGCLIASSNSPTDIVDKFSSMSWLVKVVPDGKECLAQLQTRNWNVVMIDDHLPVLSGVDCILEFRKWEEQNRINGQKNVFLMFDGDLPSPNDKKSLIQAPNGFNGVLGKPTKWDDLQTLLETSCAHGMDIVIKQSTRVPGDL